MTKKLSPELKHARASERERIRQRKQDEKDRLLKGRKRTYPVWTTSDELSYLRDIGNHTVYTPRFTRLELLEKYLASTKKNRVNWGAIDAEKVTDYIQKSIRLIKDKQHKA